MATNKGEMFIELIVGIAILTLTLVGVVTLSTLSIKTSRVAGDRNVATTIAEKTLETIRQTRGDDRLSFFNHAAGSVTATPYSCGPVANIYTCTESYLYSGVPVDQVKVSVVVSWAEGGGTSQVSMSTYFTNNH